MTTDLISRAAAITLIATRIFPVRRAHPVRVGVDGRTASGKTTLADELAAELHRRGRAVIRTSVDGFHRAKADRYRQGRLSPEGYLDDARDWQAIGDVLLRPLGPDGNRAYRTETFDLSRDEPVERPTRVAPPDATLIVDGTFLQRPELAGCWDMVVFVDVSEEVAMARGIARDAPDMGGLDAARDAHARRYQPAFDIYEARYRPKSSADIIFCNEGIERLTFNADTKPQETTFKGAEHFGLSQADS